MEQDKLFLKCKTVRDICLKNAEDLLVSAKLLINRNLQHIQYHLSALALEEIGKAELLEMSLVADINQRDATYEKSGMEDHVRKLYWAFWGPSFGKKIITKKEIEELQGLANSVHLTRLSTLYVNPSDTVEPKLRLSQQEADEITKLAEARLEMEKSKTMLDPDDPSINKEELKWFLESNTDPDKFKLIFGSKSQEKLVEIGNVRDWVHWLKVQFDQNDIEIKKLIDEEVGREKPSKEDAKKPKYKIKVRINSESHAIRSKELNKWNENSDFIKIFTDNKQDLIFEIMLTKAVHINGTWPVGWGIARAFVAALNISTNGFFGGTFLKIDLDFTKIWWT